MGIVRMPRGIEWICLGCWKRLVAKPGEPPPRTVMKGTCVECGKEHVPVTNVKKEQTDSLATNQLDPLTGLTSGRCAHERADSKMGRELNPHMPSRETGLWFLIDTNRINARRTLPYMNQLDQWRKDEVIGLLMPDVAHGEAKAGHNAERSRKASCTVFTISYTHNHVAREMHSRISKILSPDGCHSQNEENDVAIVLAAWQHRPYPLITADRGILRKREELARLEISVMTDGDAVALVRERIRERDDEARDFAANSAESLPCWIGKD